MRLIRILGPCLVAVLVASLGVLAASASAQLRPPRWYECVKLEKQEAGYAGRFKNNKCSEAAANPAKEGRYELKPGIGEGTKLTGKIGTSTLVVKSPLGVQKIVCVGGRVEGGLPAEPNLVTGFKVAYKKCSIGGTSRCHSTLPKSSVPNAHEGEIKTTELEGELGWINESLHTVGLRVEAVGGEEIVEGEPQKPLAKFECGVMKMNKTTHKKEFSSEVSASVYGQLIGEQTEDVGQVNKHLTLNYVPGEYYGTHEFEGETYSPEVNIIGWASEVEGITRAQEENKEAEDPAHVLKGVYCGALVVLLLHRECTPLTDSGLEWKATIRGAALMVKEEEEA